MVRFLKDHIVAAIDIGTTKICVLIGKKIAEHVEIIGIGKSVSYGMQKGIVVDVAKTINALSGAIKEAELMAGISLESACIGISGSHIRSVQSTGVIAIKHGVVRPSDIAQVLDAAKSISLEQGQQILHILPQYYLINGKEKVTEPIGMYAVRLELYAYVIIGSVSSVQNLLYCCESAGVAVTDVVLEQLASAEAVLSEDELDLGVGLLDIGGGTSDFAVYKNRAVQHTMVLPVAGTHVTQDIAIGLRIMKNEAERIKKLYGLADSTLAHEKKLIEVEMMQGNDLQVICVDDLVHIIELRMKELFELVNQEVTQKNLKKLMTNGLVLTGGGSLIGGAQECAARIFDCPVRIGKPRVLFDLVETLQSPPYATGYGLLLYEMRNSNTKKNYAMQGPLLSRVVERMKSWMVDFF